MMKYVVRVRVSGYVDVEVRAENDKDAMRSAESAAEYEDADIDEFEAEDILECSDGKEYFFARMKDGQIPDGRYFELEDFDRNQYPSHIPEAEVNLAAFRIAFPWEDPEMVLNVVSISAEDYENAVHPLPIQGQISCFEGASQQSEQTAV